MTFYIFVFIHKATNDQTTQESHPGFGDRSGSRLGDEIEKLNIEQTECYFQLEAKTCGCNENRSIAYSVVDSFHGLCIGKNDILIGQIQACERSLDNTNIMVDRIALLGEIAHLRLMLNLASLK